MYFGLGYFFNFDDTWTKIKSCKNLSGVVVLFDNGGLEGVPNVKINKQIGGPWGVSVFWKLEIQS